MKPTLALSLLTFALIGLGAASAQSSEETNLKLEKQQLELQKQQIELDRKSLELERKRLELERAKVPAAGEETVEKAEAVFKVKLEGDILFDFEKTELKPGAEKVLSTVVAVVSQFPTGKVFIDGHTDSKGKDSVNLDFSLRRAESVKKYLIKQGGVSASQITTRGLGETQPIAANETADGADNPDGRALNRRVEITVLR